MNADRMMDIARGRYSGEEPLRPSIERFAMKNTTLIHFACIDLNMNYFLFAFIFQETNCPNLIESFCREYGVAIVWAEGALKIAESEEEALEIGNFLNEVRVEHNNNWKSPQGKNNII